LNRASGYSLVEMMLVVGIMGVVASMAVFQIGQSRPGALADGAMRVVISQMMMARERAITERRNMRMIFQNNAVTVAREESPGPNVTTFPSVPFESSLQYLRLLSSDTPDGFAPGTIATTGAVYFPTAPPAGPGLPPEIKFTPDGRFVNQDGATLNGTVFIALPGTTTSARAVTIMGTTGRIRGYRYDGVGWKPV
jgi:prepilin-type N-terminal cleavage/methylation domain-containing protein